MSKTSDRIRQFAYGDKSNTPVDERIPEEWEPAEQITQSDITRQIHDRGEPAPKILTRFQKGVLPVYPQPSDRFSTASYPLVTGQQAIPVVSKQDAGVACRVTLAGYPVANDLILIAPKREYLTPQSTTPSLPQQSGFILPMPFAQFQMTTPITIVTADEIFAITVGTGSTAAAPSWLSVLVETYEPDARTWEPWQAGQD